MKYKVAKSKIHGDGIFATQPIAKGEYISDTPDYIDDVNQTIASSFNNHDEKNANLLNVKRGNKRFLIAKRGIEVGEELTTDYNLTPSPPFEDPNDFKNLDERELSLSDEEVQEMIDAGYELEELHEGGEPGHTHDLPLTYAEKMKAYADSSKLYDAYKFQRHKMRQIYPKILAEDAEEYPGGYEALQATRDKTFGKFGKRIYGADWSFNKRRNYDDKNYREKVITDYYKKLIGSDPNFKIGDYSSPDLFHKTIKPIGAYFDGIASSPIYRKPTKPIKIPPPPPPPQYEIEPVYIEPEIDELPIIQPSFISNPVTGEVITPEEKIQYKRKFGFHDKEGKPKRAKLRNFFSYRIPELINSKKSRSIKYKTPKGFGFYNEPIEDEQIYPEGFVPMFEDGGPHDPPLFKEFLGEEPGTFTTENFQDKDGYNLELLYPRTNMKRRPTRFGYDDYDKGYTEITKGDENYRGIKKELKPIVKQEFKEQKLKKRFPREEYYTGNKTYKPSQEFLDQVAYQAAHKDEDKMGDTDVLVNMIYDDLNLQGFDIGTNTGTRKQRKLAQRLEHSPEWYAANALKERDALGVSMPIKNEGGPTVKQRRGVRKNPDGSVSTHLMMVEYIPERGWVAFPSLFQDSKPYADDQQNWIDMSWEEDWWKVYEEAERRGEVYDFGEDKEAALAFGEGSWKDQLPQQKHGGSHGGEDDWLNPNYSFQNFYSDDGNTYTEIINDRENDSYEYKRVKDKTTGDINYFTRKKGTDNWNTAGKKGTTSYRAITNLFGEDDTGYATSDQRIDFINKQLTKRAEEKAKAEAAAKAKEYKALLAAKQTNQPKKQYASIYDAVIDNEQMTSLQNYIDAFEKGEPLPNIEVPEGWVPSTIDAPSDEELYEALYGKRQPTFGGPSSDKNTVVAGGSDFYYRDKSASEIGIGDGLTAKEAAKEFVDASIDNIKAFTVDPVIRTAKNIKEDPIKFVGDLGTTASDIMKLPYTASKELYDYTLGDGNFELDNVVDLDALMVTADATSFIPIGGALGKGLRTGAKYTAKYTPKIISKLDDAARVTPGAQSFGSGTGSLVSDVRSGVNEIKNLVKGSSKTNKNIRDWSKWNKETAADGDLVKQLNTVEETLKKQGTWMKNADGTPYTGSKAAQEAGLVEEEFIMINSPNFKKAYPQGYDQMYTGRKTDNLDNIIEAYPEGRSIFGSSDVNVAKHYATNDDLVFDLIYPKSSANIKINNQGKGYRSIEVDPNMNIQNMYEGKPVGNTRTGSKIGTDSSGNPIYSQQVTTDDIASHLEREGLGAATITDIFDGVKASDVQILNMRPGNYPKTIFGNKGYFDLNNPARNYKQGGFVLDLDEEETKRFAAGGYVLEELPTYNNGGKFLANNVAPFFIEPGVKLTKSRLKLKKGGLVRFDDGGGIDSKLEVKHTYSKEHIDDYKLRYKKLYEENPDLPKASFEEWFNFILMDQRTENNPNAEDKFTHYMVINEDGTGSVYDGQEIQNRIWKHGRRAQQLIDAGLPEGDHPFLQEHFKRAEKDGEIRYMNHIKKGLNRGMSMDEIKKDMLDKNLISEVGWNEKYEGKTTDHINTEYDKLKTEIEQSQAAWKKRVEAVGSKIDPALMDVEQLQMDPYGAYRYQKPEPAPEVKYQRIAGTAHMEPIIDPNTIAPNIPQIPDPNAVSLGEQLYNKMNAGPSITQPSWDNLSEFEKSSWNMQAAYEDLQTRNQAIDKKRDSYTKELINQEYIEDQQEIYDNTIQLDPNGKYIGEGLMDFDENKDPSNYVPFTEQEIKNNELDSKIAYINAIRNAEYSDEFKEEMNQRLMPSNYLKVGKDAFGRENLVKGNLQDNINIQAAAREYTANFNNQYGSGRISMVYPEKFFIGPPGSSFAGLTKNLVGKGFKGLGKILQKNPINWASRNLIGKEMPGWLNYATTPGNVLMGDFAYESFKPDGMVSNFAQGIQDVVNEVPGGRKKIIENSWPLLFGPSVLRGGKNLIRGINEIRGAEVFMPTASNSRFGNYALRYTSPSGNTIISRANPDYVASGSKNFKPSFEFNFPGIGRFQGARYTQPTATGYTRSTSSSDPFGSGNTFSLNASGIPSSSTSSSGFSFGDLSNSFRPTIGAQSMNMGFGTDFNLGLQNFKNTLFPSYTAPTSSDVKFRPTEITRVNPKTGLNEIYRANLPDRIVPGRSYEDVKHKMSNLYRDLGYNSILGPKASFNLDRVLPGSNNEISLVRDSGITYNPQSGSLFDSNSRYWANRRLGITPSPDQFHSTMQNQIIDDQSEFVGFAGSDAKPGINYLNEPLVSSYDTNLRLGLTSEGRRPFSGFSINEPYMTKDALGNINISKGKGRTMSYDDANEFYTGLGQRYPSLNIESPSVYFHGTTSATLPGFMQQQGLMNQGDLLNQGVVPAAGENFIGAQGMNQSMLSTVFGTDISNATRYSLMGNNTNPQSDFQNWWTEGRMKYLQDRGESSLMPEAEYYDKLYTDRVTQFENASDVEKTFLSENFPIMFGINPRSGDASRFVIPRSDISGEVGIKGKLDFGDVPQIFVPRSRMQITKDYLGNDFQIHPIDPFFQNMDWRNKWQQEQWKKLGYKKGGGIEMNLSPEDVQKYIDEGYILEEIN